LARRRWPANFRNGAVLLFVLAVASAAIATERIHGGNVAHATENRRQLHAGANCPGRPILFRGARPGTAGRGSVGVGAAVATPARATRFGSRETGAAQTQGRPGRP